jgi:hypothetical protein
MEPTEEAPPKKFSFGASKLRSVASQSTNDAAPQEGDEVPPKKFSFGASKLRSAPAMVAGGGKSRQSFGRSTLKQSVRPSVNVANGLKSVPSSHTQNWDRRKLEKVTTKRMSLEQYKKRVSQLRLSIAWSSSAAYEIAGQKSLSAINDDDSDDGEGEKQNCLTEIWIWIQYKQRQWEEIYLENPKICCCITLQVAGLAMDRLSIIIDLLADIVVLAAIAEQKETHFGLYSFAVFLFFFPFVVLWVILYIPILKLVKAKLLDGDLDTIRHGDEADIKEGAAAKDPESIYSSMESGTRLKPKSSSNTSANSMSKAMENNKSTNNMMHNKSTNNSMRSTPSKQDVNIKNAYMDAWSESSAKVNFKAKQRTKKAERRALLHFCSGMRLNTLFAVLYTAFGFFVFFFFDFLLATRYLLVDMEGRGSRWKEYMLYYEKLRKIVECTCEALPQILFQIYILTAANEVLKIHPPIIVFSVMSSLLVLYLRTTEIYRGAHYRQISVKEHIIQILNVGMDATPHLAGIGSGKMLAARYHYMRLSTEDVKCIMRSMQSPICRLQKLNLVSSRLELPHIKILCMSLIRIAATTGGTLTDLDLSDNEGIGYGGCLHLAEMIKRQRSHFSLGLNGCAIVGLRAKSVSQDWQRYSEDGVVALAQAVESRSFFTDLGLGMNRICFGARQGALQAICAAINYGQLRRLDLAHNDIDDEMAKLIATAMPHSVSLIDVDLRSNNFGKEGAEALVDAVMHEMNQASILEVLDEDEDEDNAGRALNKQSKLAKMLQEGGSPRDGPGGGQGAQREEQAEVQTLFLEKLCGIPINELRRGEKDGLAFNELLLTADTGEAKEAMLKSGPSGSQGGHGRRTLQEGGALLLAHFLARTVCPRLQLQRLDLSANLLCFRGNTRGFIAVCMAISEHPIKELDLSGNDIAVGGIGSASSREGVAAVEEMLERMKGVLEVIDLSENSMNPEQAQTVDTTCLQIEARLLLSDDPRALDARSQFESYDRKGKKGKKSSHKIATASNNPFHRFEKTVKETRAMATEVSGGWLLKRSDGRLKGLHKWDRRQFVRRGRLLHYYADEHRDQLRGLIDLTKIKSIGLSPKTTPPSPDYEVFKVVLAKPNPKWTFAAPIGQARGWMRRIAVMKDAAIATRKPEILRKGWLEKRGRFNSIRERYCTICRCSMRPPEKKGAVKSVGVGSKIHLKKAGGKQTKHGAAELAAGMDPDMEDLMLLFYMDKDMLELTGGIDLKSIISAEVTAPEASDGSGNSGGISGASAWRGLGMNDGSSVASMKSVGDGAHGDDEHIDVNEFRPSHDLAQPPEPGSGGGGASNALRSFISRFAPSNSDTPKRAPMQMFRLFAQHRVYAFAAPLEEEGECHTGMRPAVAEAWVQCVKDLSPWLEVSIWDRSRSTGTQATQQLSLMARTATRTATISMAGLFKRKGSQQELVNPMHRQPGRAGSPPLHQGMSNEPSTTAPGQAPLQRSASRQESGDDMKKLDFFQSSSSKHIKRISSLKKTNAASSRDLGPPSELPPCIMEGAVANLPPPDLPPPDLPGNTGPSASV